MNLFDYNPQIVLTEINSFISNFGSVEILLRPIEKPVSGIIDRIHDAT